MTRGEQADGAVPAGPAAGVAYVVAADAALREAIAEVLRRSGWETTAFPSVTHLTARLDSLAPGCIVSAPCVGMADVAVLMGELAERGCPFPVVALTPEGDVATAVKAMKAGAADVVALPLDPPALADAVRGAVADHCPDARCGGVPEAVRLLLDRLTRRERQVLDAIVRGDGNKAIAHALGISRRTVEVHRAKVMEKLSCRSLPDIIRLAVQAGLLRV